MRTIDGSHGTCASRAQSIEKFGWRLKSGRAGTAVYFWVKSSYYIKLARAWHRQLIAENRLKYESDLKCCIIIAHIECDEKEILNCETEGLRESILELAIEKKVNLNSPHKIAPVFDLFIKRLEEKAEITYKALLIKVPTPKKDYLEEYPYLILSSPLCCAVRNTDCIDIINIIE